MKNVLAYSINVPTKTPQIGADPELVLCTTNSVLYKWNRVSQVWQDISSGSGDSIIVVDDLSATLKPDGLSLILGSEDSGAGVDRSIEMIPDDATADIQFNNSDGGFEFNSTTGGLVPPRLTTAQRDALVSPEDGTIIRNTEDGEIQVYDADGETWDGLVPPSGGGGSGVVSLSGTGVDNSDPHNPVVNARPYLVYTALLTQTGTSAPVATVLENTLGGTPAWQYEDVGEFTATLAGAFTVGKTWVLIGTSESGTYGSYNVISNTVGIVSSAGNGTLTNRPIEIRVYP